MLYKQAFISFFHDREGCYYHFYYGPQAAMISRARYALLNIYHILIDGLFDTVPIILSFMALAFGGNEKTVGLIVSLGAALGTVAGLSTLFFSQAFGFSGTVALVTGGFGLCFVGAALAGNLPVAGACFVLAVAGFGVFHNIAFSYITLHTERAKLGRAMSDFTAIGDIGRIPLVSFAAYAAALTFMGFPGWRAVCLVYGALALAAALWLFCATRGEKAEQTVATPAKKALPCFALLRERDVFLSMLASVMNAFSNDRIFTFLPLLLIARGMEPTIIGSFALGFTVGSFLGKMACGRFVDRFGSRRIFIIAELVLAVLLGILLFSSSLVVIMSIALLLGIVTKGTVPVIQAIITEPVQQRGSYEDIFSINSFLRGITNMTTPLLFGFIASTASLNVVYALMAVMAGLAVLPILLMGKRDSTK